MKIYRATTIEDAIIINYDFGDNNHIEKMVDKNLDELFGDVIGNYFILSSQVRTDMKNNTYKMLLVEDKDGDKHHIYFKLDIYKEIRKPTPPPTKVIDSKKIKEIKKDVKKGRKNWRDWKDYEKNN